ncbi:MAG: helix-turn-helix transcriptional regulator [Lachnospiraceae bacterium]|nr:helix-turn-helix transcriptional regulator [Lachnospiraceae bacterium]
MLTDFGKACRKLRIDNDELLLDMANYLGVSAAFLSKVENGKAKPPVEWKEKIASHYDITGAAYSEICTYIDKARNAKTLKIPNIQEDDSDLMLAFARKLGNMTNAEKEDWRKKLDR